MIRRYIAEFVGTFGIVFAPVAFSAVTNHTGDGPLMAAAWVSGLAVLAMIYALGPISAAHFNPAVTLGFAVAGRFPWRFVWGYWLAQFGGAIAAAGVVALLFGGGHGVHGPANGVVWWQAVCCEAVLTFLLMLVIIAVATDTRVGGVVPGLAIGFVVVAGVLVGGVVTGGSMNPARSLGPALFALIGGNGAPLAAWWIYLTGPVLGAVAASRLYEFLRAEPQYACCAPHTLCDAHGCC